jgi:polygalacturonase
VRVEGVQLASPAAWTCYFKECDGVVARDVTIHGHANFNNDGFDIDSKNVLIEDCTVDSDDDAICLKSDNPDFVCENVEVRNCRLSSNCNFIKFGTASRGGFRNCHIHHCTLLASETSRLRKWIGLPGVTDTCTGLAGIALEMVDGGVMENVHVHDIMMLHGVQTPILVRLARRRTHKSGAKSFLRDVLIENVTSKSSASIIASSITGVPGLRPQNIVLRNLDLVFPGGGTTDMASSVPDERERSFPMPTMFRAALPAYGLYVRHADGVRLENVKMRLAPGAADARPALVTADADVSRVSP